MLSEKGRLVVFVKEFGLEVLGLCLKPHKGHCLLTRFPQNCVLREDIGRYSPAEWKMAGEYREMCAQPHRMRLEIKFFVPFLLGKGQDLGAQSVRGTLVLRRPKRSGDAPQGFTNISKKGRCVYDPSQ